MSKSDEISEKSENGEIHVSKEGNGNKTIQDVLDKCEEIGRIVIEQEKFNKEMTEKQDKLMEEFQAIQNNLKGRKRKLEIEVPSIDKRAKEEQPPMNTTRQNVEPIISKMFVFKHVFKDVLSMENSRFSSNVREEHFAATWEVLIQHKMDHLAYFIFCTIPEDVDNWSIDVECEVKLSSNNGSGKLISKPDAETSERDCVWRCIEYVEWDKLEDYLIDGNLKFEVTFKIKKMNGDYQEMRKFDESMKNVSDVILNVNDKKFYVSKLTLACHSPYFESLFLGSFKESNELEIKLSGIDSDDFQMYLEILYFLNPINEYNVEGILLIADMYDTKVVIRKCEEFLMTKSNKALNKKLEMAAQYNLHNLKKDILSQIKTRDDMKKVLPNNLRSMDPSIMAELFEKSFMMR